MEKELVQNILMEYRQENSVTVISGGCVNRIELDDICYISKAGDFTTIHTLSKRYLTLYCLADILRDLPVNDFFRVSKSHIVSGKKIAAIEKNRIRVADRWLPFSGSYRREMVKHLGMLLTAQYATFSIGKKP